MYITYTYISVNIDVDTHTYISMSDKSDHVSPVRPNRSLKPHAKLAGDLQQRQ